MRQNIICKMENTRRKSKLAARNSIKQMEGGLKEKIDEIKDILLNDDARIEAYLDDPENLDLDGFDVQLNDDIRNMKEKLNNLIDSSSSE